MAYQTITVSYDGTNLVETPNPLPPTGHFSAPVQAGRHVQWVAGTGVTEILSVTMNPSPGIFSELPTSSNSWKGTVSETASGKDSYTVTANTKDGIKSFDPELKVDQDPVS